MGNQCCDKSFAIETISVLLNMFAILNCDDLNKVFGKFNAVLANKILFITNLIKDSLNVFGLNAKLKSSII